MTGGGFHPRRVVVFGASGDQGEAQMRQLAAAGHRPVAAMRNPAAAPPGWETVRADYADPASIRAAVEGADAVFLTLPSTSFQKAELVIDGADHVARCSRDAGVPVLVFNASMIICDQPMDFAAHDARFRIRSSLFASGVPTISIQPVIYLDNLLRGWAWPDIANEDMIRYPHKETLDVCWISQDDTAKLMIAAMDRPDLAGRGFNVGGREPIRGPDLARRLSAVAGRTLGFETLPIPDFADRMARVFGGSATIDRDALIGALSRIYGWYNEGAERPFFVDMAPILADLPVTLETVEDWGRRQNWTRGA